MVCVVEGGGEGKHERENVEMPLLSKQANKQMNSKKKVVGRRRKRKKEEKQ